LAFLAAGDSTNYQHFLSEMGKTQCTNGGVPYSTSVGSVSEFVGDTNNDGVDDTDVTTTSLSVAGTAWLILAEQNVNPFCVTCDVGACPGATVPSLVLTATAGGTLVAGRACGGSAVDPVTLANDYEVIVYAETDTNYIQPSTIDFRHPILPDGYFDTWSHSANVIHAFLVRRGLDWVGQTRFLPPVDGQQIIARADYDLGTGTTVHAPAIGG
jgi:hypothetical protein